MSNDSLAHLDDLEIYIANNNLDDITGWLQTSFDQFDVVRQSKKGCKFRCGSDGHFNNGMIVLNAGRTGYTSIWIDGKNTPWKNDVEMGRSACNALHSTVRCVESAWSKGDDPDRWLEITSEGENIIQWITED